MSDIAGRFLFNYEITDWDTWSRVFRSIEEFAPLIRGIFGREGLCFTRLENCKPGTNGVFRVGPYVVKVFVPRESGHDSEPDYRAELFAMERASRLGVSVPRLAASGQIVDRYLFRYLIMDHIAGPTLGEIKSSLSPQQKFLIGRSLREMVTAWGTECEDFNNVDAIVRTRESRRWADAPAELRAAQQRCLDELKDHPKVYVHGDLTEDNLIISPGGGITVIDFADSLRAPAVYEDMTIICDAFGFEWDFLRGYYGDIGVDELANLCLQAIMCHEYGYNVSRSVLGSPADQEDLRRLIRDRLSSCGDEKAAKVRC